MKKMQLTSLEEFKDQVFGKPGTKKREDYEKGFQEFYKQEMAELEKQDKIKSKKTRLAGSNTQRSTSRPQSRQ